MPGICFTVNQRGEIQAAGGTNERIEGFHAVCQAKGLTSEQAVIIPQGNVTHLMLRQEVVDAVRDGRFQVWSVANVDEGIDKREYALGWLRPVIEERAHDR